DLRCLEPIDLEPPARMFNSLISEIYTVGLSTRAHPLEKIRTGSNSNLEHLPSMSASELGEGKDLGLDRVPCRLDLLEILPCVLRRNRYFAITRTRIPIIVHRTLEGLGVHAKRHAISGTASTPSVSTTLKSRHVLWSGAALAQSAELRPIEITVI